MKAAVIGSPVSHSLSPAIFKFISLDQGSGIDYSSIEVKPGELENFIEGAKEAFVGFNVTIPLKEYGAKLADELSPSAEMMGAVNVLLFKDKKICGYNTDVIGIEKTLLKLNAQIHGEDCLLWGAGGSAKAAAYVLGKFKARNVFVFNRGSRGKELSEKFSEFFPETKFKSISSLSEIGEAPISLMINATSLGMQGQESGSEYFSQARNLKFRDKALAFDLVYIPETTDFINMAKGHGLESVGGIGMLIDQALATWEIWIAPLNDEERLHQRLRLFLKGILYCRYNPEPIYLTGFMGVGKSTVARELALLTKRELLDSDKEIETSAGLTITQIFQTKGEEDFRRRERDALSHLAASQQSIISLGGGALETPSNLETVLRSGKLIYLEASAKILNERIQEQGQTRPLLAGLNNEERMEKINDLLSQRTSSYEKAVAKINTESLNPIQVCFEVISKIGELA